MPLAAVADPLRSLLLVLALAPVLAFSAAERAAAAPEGTMTWGVHVSLATRWFDPRKRRRSSRLHGALRHPRRVVKPMSGKNTAPSLAETWTVARTASPTSSPAQWRQVPQRRPNDRGGREVLLRSLSGRGRQADQGPGQGGSDRRPSPGPHRPERALAGLMAFFGTTASGAGWMVPKKYVEKVGEEGFKKAPVGAGPYKVVSSIRAWTWCSKPSTATGGSRPASSASSSAPSPRSRRGGGGEARRGGHRLFAPAPSPRSSSGRPASRSPPRCPRSGSAGWTSRSRAMRSRRGTTRACAWPRASRWTARR